MQQRPHDSTGAPPGLLSALSFANFAIGIGAFVAIGVLSPIASGLNLSHSQAGMVMSIYALAYAVGSPLAIAATGKLDRKRVILIGLGVFLIASILCAISANAEMLLASRALGALGAGMVTPVGAAIAAAKSPPERRGAALSFVILGLTLAQAGGIPLGSFLGYTAGWRAAFWLVAAMTALAIIGVAWRVPRIHTPVTNLASLGRTLTSPVLMPAILVTASMMTAAWILFTYFAPLLEERMGYGRNGVTAMLVVIGVGAVIGNMLGGRLSDRIGPARSMIVVTLCLIAVLPAFSLLPLPDAVVVAAHLRLGTGRLGLHGAATEPHHRAGTGEPERLAVAQCFGDLRRRGDRLGGRRGHRRRPGLRRARLDGVAGDDRGARPHPADGLALDEARERLD